MGPIFAAHTQYLLSIEYAGMVECIFDSPRSPETKAIFSYEK